MGFPCGVLEAIHTVQVIQLVSCSIYCANDAVLSLHSKHNMGWEAQVFTDSRILLR